MLGMGWLLVQRAGNVPHWGNGRLRGVFVMGRRGQSKDFQGDFTRLLEQIPEQRAGSLCCSILPLLDTCQTGIGALAH